MGVYLPLPSAYQEVEYIQSSGTQYINTLYKPTNNTKVECKWFFTSWWWFGVWKQGSYQSIFLGGDWTNYRARCRSGSSSNSTVTSTVPHSTTPHVFEISQWGGFLIDGVSYGTFTSYTYSESYNIYMFGRNTQGTFIDGGNIRFYYFKIYENWTLVRDFIPCYRKSDNVIGLYDLVNSQFYTNSWSGTFSKWADVTAVPLKNAYIGEYIEENYTFSWFTGSTSESWTTVYNSISKSGCTVESVTITASCTPTSGYAYVGSYLYITADTTRNYEAQLSLNYGSWNTGTFSGIRYRTGGSNTDEYNVASYLNYTSTNTFTVEFTRTWWKLTMNWTNFSWTYGSGMSSVINTIMNSSNIQFRTNMTRSSVSQQTVTVGYTKN